MLNSEVVETLLISGKELNDDDEAIHREIKRILKALLSFASVRGWSKLLNGS